MRKKAPRIIHLMGVLSAWRSFESLSLGPGETGWGLDTLCPGPTPAILQVGGGVCRVFQWFAWPMHVQLLQPSLNDYLTLHKKRCEQTRLQTSVLGCCPGDATKTSCSMAIQVSLASVSSYWRVSSVRVCGNGSKLRNCDSLNSRWWTRDPAPEVQQQGTRGRNPCRVRIRSRECR